MLDRVIELLPGERAMGRYRTSGMLRALPQVVLLEAVAQLAGIIVARGEGGGGFLAAIENASFGPVPLPGDTLDIFATVQRSFGRIFQVEGEVVSDGVRILSATITIGIGAV